MQNTFQLKSKIQFVWFLLLVLSFSSFGQKCDRSTIDSLKIIVNQENFKVTDRIDAWNKLSKCYSYFDLDSANYFAEIAQRKSKKSDYTRGVAVSTYNLAKVQNRIGEKDNALILLKQCIELYAKIEKDINYFNAINDAGIIFELQHNYDKALEYYYKGLRDAEQLGFRLDVGFFYNNISVIHTYTGEKLKELEYLRKASNIFQALGEDYFYSYTLVNLGSYYNREKEKDTARKYFLEAEPLLINDKNFYGLANLYHNLGRLSLESGFEKEALDYFHKALESAIQIDSLNPDRENRVSSISIELAKLYLSRQEIKIARNYFQAAFSLGLKYNSLMHLHSSSDGLFNCFLYLNDIDSALYYHNLSLQYSDSLHLEKYNERIDKLNYDHKLYKEKELFEKNKALLVLKKNRQELIYLVVAGLLLIIVFVVIIVWYLQKIKLQKSELKRVNLHLLNENMNASLEKKNKELTTTVLNLIERNEFISKLSGQLQNNLTVGSKERNANIEEVIKTIDKDSINSLWNEFEVRYMEVHKEFHEKLTGMHPDLTANERRLCAFIYLNLSTKDISSITYQSINSIKIARYRLRKKMGLDKNENLTAFLHNL